MPTHFTIPAAIDTRVSATAMLRVHNRDAHTCVYCGRMGVSLHVDHVRPQAHFPATAPTKVVNAPTNLVTACSVCNNAKSGQTLRGFAEMLRNRGVAAKKVAAMVARVRAATRKALPPAP
jgi:5-methylcytosine-specific restriction endonuclease McrA